MRTPSPQTLGGFLLVLRGYAEAQITLAPIPTSACVGQGLSGSATFASSISLATGAQRIPAGDFWNQVGAEWVFDTDTSGVLFSDLAANDGPDTPAIDSKAVSLDDSSTKWTFSAASGVSEVDIVFNAGPTSAAKFRRAASSFELIITASVPCSDDAGQPSPTPTATNSQNAANPSQASLCSNAAIETTDTDEWSNYGVDTYVSSVLAAAATNSLSPQVDAAKVLQEDVGAADECQYTTPCDDYACKDIKDSASGSNLVIQRYLAYNAFINLNNFFEVMISQLLTASNNGLGISTAISTTFYTDPPPATTWSQIMGAMTPFLGILSAVLGPIGAATESAVVASVQSIMGAATGIQATKTSPVIDQRFTEAGDIDQWTQNYLQATYPSLEAAYELTIGNASAASWTSTEGGNKPVMAGGEWLTKPYSSTFVNTMLDNFDKIVTYKMINYIWNASDTFVVYVPYGPVMLNSDKMGTVSASDCNGWKGSDPFLNCNAPGPGMARVFNPNNAKILDTTNPMGATSGFKVGIATPVPIDITLVTAGAVNSWLAGNYNYDLSDAYPDVSQGKLSGTDAASLAKLSVTQDTAGFFNLPVCKVLDLRSFPNAAAGTGYANTLCGCASGSAVGGASNGGNIKFYDSVSSKIQKYVLPAPVKNQNGNCPGDLNPALNEIA
ncbi:hypothetical protein HO133_007554 [Letharia lupina]|uniref:Uncharacterized protein n=1 Tax=Letharia lupina TaxID=560253 RepID=A0A8H6KYY4_9LECA|nr:uncharacterized protein HO133_007554 [Letharia lupina]KAF6229438.1 hypothetical protein HO133_007554 [Letharia lupina]